MQLLKTNILKKIHRNVENYILKKIDRNIENYILKKIDRNIENCILKKTWRQPSQFWHCKSDKKYELLSQKQNVQASHCNVSKLTHDQL